MLCARIFKLKNKAKYFTVSLANILNSLLQRVCFLGEEERSTAIGDNG